MPIYIICNMNEPVGGGILRRFSRLNMRQHAGLVFVEYSTIENIRSRVIALTAYLTLLYIYRTMGSIVSTHMHCILHLYLVYIATVSADTHADIIPHSVGGHNSFLGISHLRGSGSNVPPVTQNDKYMPSRPNTARDTYRERNRTDCMQNAFIFLWKSLQ